MSRDWQSEVSFCHTCKILVGDERLIVAAAVSWSDTNSQCSEVVR
jgi:hypothetical protein